MKQLTIFKPVIVIILLLASACTNNNGDGENSSDTTAAIEDTQRTEETRKIVETELSEDLKETIGRYYQIWQAALGAPYADPDYDPLNKLLTDQALIDARETLQELKDKNQIYTSQVLRTHPKLSSQASSKYQPDAK